MTHLYILGKGKTTELETLAHHLHIGDRIHFLGGRPSVMPYLQAADYFLHPARQETAGMALIEALIVGLPILTTESTGYAFHVKAAHAGKIIPEPFDEYVFNEAFAEFISAPTSQYAAWHTAALTYAAHQDLVSLPEQASHWIEQSLVQNPSIHHRKV